MSVFVLSSFFLLPLMTGAAVRWSGHHGGRMQLLLSFSGAFLLGVVFLHMLPELYADEGELIGIWVLTGFLLQVVLEFFSRGIEHGHVHVAPGMGLPLVTMASLCIHSFVEGVPFADPQVSGNLHFVAGVLMHKVPMAVALATVLMRSGTGSGQSWSLLTIFALAAPAGIVTGHFAGGELGEGFLHAMLAVAIGMLLHIGTTIIFESAPEHRIDRARFLAVLLGATLSALSMH